MSSKLLVVCSNHVCSRYRECNSSREIISRMPQIGQCTVTIGKASDCGSCNNELEKSHTDRVVRRRIRTSNRITLYSYLYAELTVPRKYVRM